MIRNYQPKSVMREGLIPRPQAAMSVGFINRTGKTVTVIRRDGSRVVVSPINETLTSNTFFVDVTYSTSSGSEFINLQEMFNSDTDKRIFNDALKHGKRNGNDLSVRYEIPAAALEGSDGAYVDFLDMVFTFRYGGELPEHPRSERRALSSFSDLSDMDYFSYRVVIVDSGGFYGNRYVNIGGEVFQVPSIDERSIPDGIYITRSCGVKRQECSYYSLTDARCPLKLHVTHAQALAYGDEVSALEMENRKEIARLKTSELEAQRELQEFKVKVDAERLERDAQHRSKMQELDMRNKELEHDLSRASSEVDYLRKLRESAQRMEEQRLRDRYDRESQGRRNTGEWLKLIGPVLSTVGLVLGIYAKRKN